MADGTGTAFEEAVRPHRCMAMPLRAMRLSNGVGWHRPVSWRALAHEDDVDGAGGFCWRRMGARVKFSRISSQVLNWCPKPGMSGETPRFPPVLGDRAIGPRGVGPGWRLVGSGCRSGPVLGGPGGPGRVKRFFGDVSEGFDGCGWRDEVGRDGRHCLTYL